VVVNGRHTRLWLDVWVDQIPLNVFFTRLFEMLTHLEASVADNYVLDIHAWDIKFRRAFGEDDIRD
jgi:hypothetical protein